MPRHRRIGSRQWPIEIARLQKDTVAVSPELDPRTKQPQMAGHIGRRAMGEPYRPGSPRSAGQLPDEPVRYPDNQLDPLATDGATVSDQIGFEDDDVTHRLERQ